MTNPYEHDESPEDEDTFACACGDEDCRGHNDDPANIRIGSAWYSADCVMANGHPEVVRSRVMDAFNQTRR